MLTREQVLEGVRTKQLERVLDGRNYERLADFFPVSDWPLLGFKLAEGVSPPEPKPWTEEVIKQFLEADVSFAFEKAFGKRGISAGLMYGVVKMWMWVLEDAELASETTNDYAQYGLPFLKAVAVKYGFPNPIGTDRGNEHKYSQEGGR